MATLEECEKLLYDAGFKSVYTHSDGPNVYYSDHFHDALTAHIILKGEMELTMGGSAKTYGPGTRVDVPAGAMHSAKMGPAGCTYLIGE